MNQMISIRRLVETIGNRCDVYALEDAFYDEDEQKLSVKLSGFVRCESLNDEHPEWMPSESSVNDSASIDETLPLAKEIFQSWVNQVRAAIPKVEAIIL